jgi:hypothetical protein
VQVEGTLDMISDEGLLFIEPSEVASTTPVIDEITRKMCAAFRKARPDDSVYAGVHECMCGAHSTSSNFHLPSGDLTNSLCVHYVAHHRSEVPPDQLARIAALAFGEDRPNEQELQSPELVRARIRTWVEMEPADRLDPWVAWGLDVEALCRGLQGGCLPGMAGLTKARQEAEDLFWILGMIDANTIPLLHESIQRTQGDVRSWGADALRLPGWKRELWPGPLADLMRLAGGDPRRSVAMLFGYLGPHAGAAVPALLELAKDATGDLKYDVGLAFEDLGRIPCLLLPPAAVPGLVALAQELISGAPPIENVRRSEPSPTLQLSAALVLARAGVNTEYAVYALLPMALADGRNSEYAVAVLCGHPVKVYASEPGIEEWGAVAFPLLLEALQSSDLRIRLRAIKLLGRLGRTAEGAVGPLRKAAEDSRLRAHVEEALLRITAPESADRIIEEKKAEDRAKAQLVVPRIDPSKPRHSQFFRFVCPFCSHSEEVGLWYSSKACSSCQKTIRIVRQTEESMTNSALCPSCQYRFRIGEAFADVHVQCPSCGEEFSPHSDQFSASVPSSRQPGPLENSEAAEKIQCPNCGTLNHAAGTLSSCIQCGRDLPGKAEQPEKDNRKTWFLLLGFSIMAIKGIVSTISQKPDGRLLNTAPHLGVDVFLSVGVIGILACVVQLIRGR